MLFCLFEYSPPIEDGELEKINKNHHLVALSGRENNLKLFGHDGRERFTEWSRNIFSKLDFIASLIDIAGADDRYRKCVESEYEKIVDPSLLPRQ
jgi:glutamate--cysteine ligase